MKNHTYAKTAAAQAALEYIKDGMCIGLGTGSTSSVFIEALAKKRLDITCVVTSQATEALALEHDLRVLPIDEKVSIDLAVDGADYVDCHGHLIKGYGGALLREKIIAASSALFYVIVDTTKMVDTFHNKQLPVEVLPFGHALTYKKFISRGFTATVRQKDNKPFITDNGNFIYDILLNTSTDYKAVEAELRTIPGVLETGFFFDIAKRVIIGQNDGAVEIRVIQ